MPPWPAWWEFPLVLSVHVQKRMQERRFSETDLRAMLSVASEFRSSLVGGQFVVTTRWEGSAWEVVVEPDELEEVLIVVTAYKVE